MNTINQGFLYRNNNYQNNNSHLYFIAPKGLKKWDIGKKHITAESIKDVKTDCKLCFPLLLYLNADAVPRNELSCLPGIYPLSLAKSAAITY